MKLLFDFGRRYVLRYVWWFAGGTLCLFATNWLSVQIPLELANAVDALRAGNQRDVLRAAIVAIAWMGAIVIGVRTLSRALFFTPGRLIESSVKDDIFAHLLRLQPAFYAKWTTGDIISRCTNDIAFVRVMCGFGTLQIVNITLALLLTGAQMIRLSPWLSLLSLLPIVIAMLVVHIGIQRLFDLSKRSQEELATLSEHVLASLQGVQAIQGFNAQEAFLRRFMQRSETYLQTNLQLARIRAWILPLLGLAGAICVWVLLAVGGSMAIHKQLSVGQLVAFIAYIAYLLMPLRSLGWLMSVFQSGLTSLQRIIALLDAPLDRPEGEHPLEIAAHGGPSFSIKHLSFAYPDAPEQMILQDITLDVPSGASIGIFGRTGSGKTTLLRLLARSYNPPPDTLFIDGVDITKLDLNVWRQRLAVAAQSPFLFSDSIAANITLGRKDDVRLQQMIARAALERDLEALPDGLDTVVGERGIMLSGGQRQRVALARAFYRDFDVLLLDDVLSAVDHKTEHELIDSIEACTHRQRDLRSRPTTFLVSHRISALMRMDLIFVLEQGRLLDVGTHAQLIERPGPYQDAWRYQAAHTATERAEK